MRVVECDSHLDTRGARKMANDYYQTLGVQRDVPQGEIERAYRKLARKYHPDLNQDDQTAKEKFQEVQQAYEILNDPEKRAMYDRFGKSMGPAGSGPGSGRQGHPDGFSGFEFDQFFGQQGGAGAGGFNGFADLFEQMNSTGGPRRRRPARPRQGADLHHEVQVPFKTAILGGEVRLSIQRAGGQIENLSAKIPAGIEDQRKIRLRGQGEPAPPGGRPGDLLITVRVTAHPCFRRHGDNLEVEVPLTLAEAVLGAKIDVPTPWGAIALTVPAGTSSGKRLRVKGHGVSGPEEQRGDLFAVLRIVVPEEIDESSAELIRQFTSQNQMDPRCELGW